MRLFLKKSRRDSVQQLQLHVGSEEKSKLDRKAEGQLVELMAETMLTVMLQGKETGDDHPSS